jgi:hypothetical protein
VEIKKKSDRDTDITAPQPKKVRLGHKNQKIDVYHAPDDHLPRFTLIRGSRDVSKTEKKSFLIYHDVVEVTVVVDDHFSSRDITPPQSSMSHVLFT